MDDDQIEGGFKQGLGRVQDAVGGLTGNERTQAEGKLNQAAGAFQSTVGKVKDKARNAFNGAEARAEDAFNDARGRARDVIGDTQAFTRENPATALAVVLGLGVLIGLALRISSRFER